MKNAINRSFSTASVIRTLLVSAAVTASFAVAAPAVASQCKGLDTKACDSTASCSWVDAYERKDGRKVNGFCRTKAKRSTAKVKPTSSGDASGQGK